MSKRQRYDNEQGNRGVKGEVAGGRRKPKNTMHKIQEGGRRKGGGRKAIPKKKRTNGKRKGRTLPGEKFRQKYSVESRRNGRSKTNKIISKKSIHTCHKAPVTKSRTHKKKNARLKNQKR